MSEQPVRRLHVALANQFANARAGDPRAVRDDVLDRLEADASLGKVGRHVRDVARALVAEPERRADRDRADVQVADQGVHERLRRERSDSLVERRNEAFFEPRPREQIETFVGVQIIGGSWPGRKNDAGCLANESTPERQPGLRMRRVLRAISSCPACMPSKNPIARESGRSESRRIS